MLDRYMKELEDRVIDLEHRDIKQRAAIVLRSWRKSTTPAGPSASVLSQYNNELYSIRQRDGSWKHEIRTAGGARTALGNDPQSYPDWVRQILDLEAKADATRTAAGRLLGFSGIAPMIR